MGWFYKAQEGTEIMIKAILFDLGNVIFHPNWPAIEKLVREKFGVSIFMRKTPEIEHLYSEKVMVGKGSQKEVFQKLIERDNPKANVDELMRFYITTYRENAKIDEKMLRLIDSLKEKFQVCALSNTGPIHTQANDERDLFKHFNKIFLSWKIGLKKPYKEIYEFILNELNLNAEELVFIDDSQKNIDNALELGIKALRFENYDKLISDFKELGLF